MASQSLRSILTYAGTLLSQLPIPFGGSDLPSPFDTSTPQPPSFDHDASKSTSSGGDVVSYMPLSGAPSCPINGPMSCHNSTPVAGDSCCFVYPSGRMLLTQFWDSEVHAGGAEEDWTLHGLW